MIAYHPAIGHLIIENKWISFMFTQTARCAGAQRSKERIECSRPRQSVTVLVKNLESIVDRLHVMIRANIPVCVGWVPVALIAPGALECQPRRGHQGDRPQNSHHHSPQLGK